MINFRNENENSAKNFNSISIGNVKLWFSYETCVGVMIGHKIFVCENIWGSTTGKHLNWLDGGDKKERLEYYEFQNLLSRLEVNVRLGGV